MFLIVWVQTECFTPCACARGNKLCQLHSCTLTPSLGLAQTIIDTFSKAVVDILEVIGGLVMPPLLFLLLVLLSKVKKVSQPRKSFMKGTVQSLRQRSKIIQMLQIQEVHPGAHSMHAIFAVFYLFFHTCPIQVIPHFQDSRQRPEDRATLLLFSHSSPIIRRHS